MRRKLSDILFRQADAADRLPLVRVSLGAAVLRTIVQMPPGSFFAEHQDTVMAVRQRGDRAVRLTAFQFNALRLLSLASVGLWTIGVRHAAVRATAAASFAVLNGYVAQFHPRLWSYNSHLNLFLCAATAVDTTKWLSVGKRPPVASTKDEAQLQSLALTAMQLGSAAIYSQAGLSKILHGKVRWMSQGTTLKGALAVLGTPAGHRLSANDSLMRALSVVTVAGEAAFLPLLVTRWKDRRLIALGAIAFHLATKRLLGISFWHLWALYPALFIVAAPGGDRR
ncbi:hypothetical protein GCM10022226_68450 [Sphaerisporangium flaviroseum]|uniref:HTTM domain-containing protein n=1 Tax=Sphaerisporangium flaviroseum TaxID=509199 RepID=A0ABP7J7K5_9ACTN